VKYELKKMKEALAEPEFQHKLENLKQALHALDDVRRREQSFEEYVAQLREDVSERVKEKVIKKAREDKKGIISEVQCLKDEVKKLKITAKETVISVVPEVVSPVERGVMFSSFHRLPSHSLTRQVPSSDACVAFSFCLLAQFS
jgi:uncharacterized coiled-coil DUF342 family protein